MLIEERLNEILEIINTKGSVTVQELMKLFHSSESTIRRDLNMLHEDGRLIKVHGGAIAKENVFTTKDADVSARKEWNTTEKGIIGQYAASLIKADDFVYIDAGTTTEQMIKYITEKRAVYVTNAVGHAKKLSKAGCLVYLLGGEFKASTEAIVGEEAMESVAKYNFTKGFFGANGISCENGITTPEIKEAMIKKTAMKHCKEVYVLTDASKMEQISAVKFAEFKDVTILTTELENERYQSFKNVREV